MNGHRKSIRRVALALAMTVLFTVFMPETAHAAESDSAWVELLEFSTVNDSGSNLFKITSSGTINIKTPQYMRCTKVDLLLAHPSGYAPSSIKLRYNGVLYPLTLQKIDNTTVRAYGENIPDTLYADLYIQFSKSSTASVQYQLLSCRVTSLAQQDFQADAEVYIGGSSYPFPSVVTIPKVSASQQTGIVQDQVRVDVYDWQKFDKLTVWGSTVDFPLTSIRATIGTLALPITVSYLDAVAAGYWTESDELESGITDDNGIYSGEDWSNGSAELMPEGKWLYCITIDLSGVDRTANYNGTPYPLYMYLTGLYDDAWGYTFTAQYVNGSIVVADTTNASWWTKFTAFFTDLLGGDKAEEGEDFANNMESQSQQMQDAVQDMDEVTRPNVDDIEVSIDGYVDSESMTAVGDIVGGLMGNDLIRSMVMISLILSLAAYVIFGKR